MKFFSKTAISFVGFWFGPLAAGYLLSQNAKRLGEEKISRKTLIATVVVTLLSFPILFLLPYEISKNIPRLLFPLITAASAHAWFAHFQEKKIKFQIENGAQKESDWRAAGIGLLLFLITMLYVVPLWLLTSFDVKTLEYDIGTFYERRENGSEALKWFRRAAEKGYPGAYSAIGLQYNWGRGVAIDYGEAFRWYQKAADLGDPEGQYNLGVYYLNGIGVKKDCLEAIGLFEKAAQQGDAQAQYNLGTIYAKGTGVKEDDVKAFEWLRKAADQGMVNAQYDIGYFYLMGAGVEKDKEEAKKWFQKAANQGDEQSQQMLKNLN